MVTYQDTSCSYNGETRIENHLEGQDTITSFSGIFKFQFAPFIYVFSNLHAEYNGGGDLSVQNKEIHLELEKKMKRLNNLKAKVIKS